MRLRYLALLLALAPSLTLAQAPHDAVYIELTVLSPESLAARISNYDYSGIPEPPYSIPDTTDRDFIIGVSVFHAFTADSTIVGLGTALYGWGPMEDLALALNADGARARGCVSAADSTSDIANGADLAGRIAMVERGTCPFYVKARNVEAEGAVAFVVFNRPDADPDLAVNMNGGRLGDPSVSIPGVFLPWGLAAPLVGALEAGVVPVAKLACDDNGPGFPCFVDAAEGGPSAAGAGLFLAGPNPTRGAPRLVVRAPAPEAVVVAAFDVTGRRVAVLHDGTVMGAREITLPAGLPAGSYFVRAVGETFRHGQQVTIVR